jgi:hypothetical protein
MRLLLAFAMLLGAARAQQPQNPSPMVEHTRAHPRLKEETPAGRREKLDLGTLFLPAHGRARAILFFFHGGAWVPEVAASRDKLAVVGVQAGEGSAVYVHLFDDPQRFLRLLAEAETKAGIKFGRVMLGGWSAGCGAVRQILKTPESYARVDAALIVDGMHTDYVDGQLDPGNLQIWLRLARDAMAGRKRMLATHSEIFPGTYASTTETADYLLAQLGLRRRAVLKWGPMGTQQLSEARAGKFRLLGCAGNSAPDHVDQLHSLPMLLKWLR